MGVNVSRTVKPLLAKFSSTDISHNNRNVNNFEQKLVRSRNLKDVHKSPKQLRLSPSVKTAIRDSLEVKAVSSENSAYENREYERLSENILTRSQYSGHERQYHRDEFYEDRDLFTSDSDNSTPDKDGNDEDNEKTPRDPISYCEKTLGAQARHIAALNNELKAERKNIESITTVNQKQLIDLKVRMITERQNAVLYQKFLKEKIISLKKENVQLRLSNEKSEMITTDAVDAGSMTAVVLELSTHISEQDEIIRALRERLRCHEIVPGGETQASNDETQEGVGYTDLHALNKCSLDAGDAPVFENHTVSAGLDEPSFSECSNVADGISSGIEHRYNNYNTRDYEPSYLQYYNDIYDIRNGIENRYHNYNTRDYARVTCVNSEVEGEVVKSIEMSLSPVMRLSSDLADLQPTPNDPTETVNSGVAVIYRREITSLDTNSRQECEAIDENHVEPTPYNITASLRCS